MSYLSLALLCRRMNKSSGILIGQDSSETLRRQVGEFISFCCWLHAMLRQLLITLIGQDITYMSWGCLTKW